MATPVKEQVEEKEVRNDFVIDLNGWKYADFKAFRAATVADDETVFGPMLQRVIVEWPYTGNPSEVNPVEVLGMADLAVLLSAVNIAVENTFRPGKTS